MKKIESDAIDKSLFAKARRITLDAQLARNANQHPDRIAFKFDDQIITYSALEKRVTALANALVERGMVHGDRVAVMMQNRIEVIEAYLATLRAGGICVPINFRFREKEVDHILRQSGSTVVILDSPSAKVVSRCDVLQTFASTVITVPTLGEEVFGEDYAQVLADAPMHPVGRLVDDHDPAFIMYTSGTTGQPKGAVLTHLNLFINTVNMIAALEISATDRRWLAGLPLFHIGGLNGILPFLYLGGTSTILPSGNFDAKVVADIFERDRITSCFFVPSQWQTICELQGLSDRNFCLERVTWGASICPTSVTDAIRCFFPQARAYNVFGQTEMSSITCALRADQFPNNCGAVGIPVPNLEVRIVDTQMQDVPAGKVGEIVYRGPTVMQEYWQMQDATCEAFRGGWFHSGDLVRQDAEGLYYVVDRKTDMIISGGENIYCPEVETVIDAHPGVREVAIVGAPHPRWVETPVAFVVAQSNNEVDEQEIINWCNERLASYKKPTRVVLIAELPRNPSGKVLKKELKKLL